MLEIRPDLLLGERKKAATVALAVVAIIGAATALVAATIGLAQTDIKRLLAFSSIAHAGYILMAFVAGIELHLSDSHAHFAALHMNQDGVVR